jgi:glucosamine--fructose-6-phosphate aminotransferase (isomerizing)
VWGTHEAECCGIVGFIGKEPAKDNAVEYLLEGLTILQNRGYDSAGVCTVNANGNLVATKYASVGSTSDSINLLKADAPERHYQHTLGIAHTRWATHGGRTDANAHPHLDYKQRIGLCHNGTIENSADIKKELMALGIPFKSETDTEVIGNLIGHLMDKGNSLPDALSKATARLEGTWGLVIVEKGVPDKMLVARHGSPLVIGIGQGRNFVASETSAFIRHTKNFIALKDDEIAVITPDSVSLEDARIEKAEADDIQLSPDPYPHWTIKEILEQPEAVSRALSYGGRIDPEGFVKLGGLEANGDITKIKNLVIAACGTSHFASRYGACLMRHLNSFETVQCIDAAELNQDFVTGFKNGGLLAITQSGETLDVMRSLEVAEACGMTRFSIVNAVGSLVARTTKCGVYTNAGREQAVASTKAFITQITVLALIAAWFSERKPHEDQGGDYTARRETLIESLHRLPTYCGMTLQKRTRDVCREVAYKLKDREHCFVLGRGYGEPIAMEGALKIKEITYLHAEGYSGAALKHGPFALIEDGSRWNGDTGTPIIMLILDDQNAQLMRTAAEEVRARGAHTIVITDNKKLAEGVAHDTIVIPSNGPLTALLAALPLQMIAYELAIAKGIDPDKPKNLAKAVTVA